MSNYSIIPPSAVFQENWPAYKVLPQGLNGSLSVGGWTAGNEGFIQQTFLGASLRSFNVNAGFGDTSSTMGLELVNDEFNTSDGTSLGDGDDVYHDGKKDHFMPPVVGSPVFFKFGKNYASTEQAFRRTFDETYGIDTLSVPDNPFSTFESALPITVHPQGAYLLAKDEANGTATWIDKSVLLDPETKWRGVDHLVFGGILQSYTENISSAGNPLYSVKLVDPREILSNTELLLNNYQGTTFNNKNLFNIYGFLEYDPSDDLLEEFAVKAYSRQVLKKNIDNQGKVTFTRKDDYWFYANSEVVSLGEISKMAEKFPITGQGFSRRSENGIPWYRVEQAMDALFDYNGEMPKEYRDAGFGGVIDFRGYNYVVDWSGIPTDEIPKTYYLDFDQINMLDLAQELCDVLSRDLFVSLLPVIDHPACAFLYKKNQEVIAKAKALPDDSPERALVLGGLIAGIIRIEIIDRSKQPTYGAVKKYLDDLESKDIFVENRDVGFEVSNVVTDKFIIGAQEVEMYYFNGLRDRDNYVEWLIGAAYGFTPNAIKILETIQHDKWTLPTNLKQQIIPFYGFIGDKAVTIPRGFGSWQQILLDARHLDAFGVGSYYIATEMELRAASISFESWAKFLLNYDEVYLQEVGPNQGFWSGLSSNLIEVIEGINDRLADGDIKDQLTDLKNRKFAVSVPRCVWNSDKSPEGGGPFEGEMGNDESGNEGFPASPCSPPFGYPLYYKRAQSIGIPQAGLTNLHTSVTTILSNIENLQNKKRSDRQRFSSQQNETRMSLRVLDSTIAQYQVSRELSNADQDKIDKAIETLKAQKTDIIKRLTQAKKDLDIITETTVVNLATAQKLYKGRIGIIKNLSSTDRQFLQNAKRVYNFVKKIADDNLGKKFLIKIPKATNVFYNHNIKMRLAHKWDVLEGPFGFEPQPISTIPDYKFGYGWQEKLEDLQEEAEQAEKSDPYWHYLDSDYGAGYTYGALKCNYNPIAEQWEYNYAPEPQGGFFNFALYDKNLSALEATRHRVSNTELPAVTRNVLAPKLLTKLITNGNRIHCYARYDHSQNLDFSNVSADSVEQQSIVRGTIIPDVLETFPNLNRDKKATLDQIEKRTQDNIHLKRQAESVAFVKCELDENFYMAPKVVTGEATIWAEQFSVNLVPPTYKVVWTKDENEKIDDPDDPGTPIDNPNFNCMVPHPVVQRIEPSFGVPKGGGVGTTIAPSTTTTSAPGSTTTTTTAAPVANLTPWDDFDREWSDTYKGWIIKTETKDLDPDHVYALITVPGKIIPTVDSRYVDGPLKVLNGVSISNSMTEDVVKIKEFKYPTPIDGGDKEIDCNDPKLNHKFTFEDINRAIALQKSTVELIGLSTPNSSSKLAFVAPSPIYPNIVALPLMSLERCYGPWLSSALDGEMVGLGTVKYSDIGGKIEFIKEEKLAPWNYAGYQLMDDAAKLKTKFSNSLLLFSERGSFSYADAPIGVSLAKALRDEGPLVTSISVDISQAIKTSVKLDLYTSQFGKMQKQKEIAISQISRERQKTIDENNILERRGIGKGAVANRRNLTGGLMAGGGQALLDIARQSNDFFTEVERGNVPSITTMTLSANGQVEEYEGSPKFFLDDNNIEGVMQSESDLQQRKSLFSDQRQLDKAVAQSAGGTIPDIFVGFSDAPDNIYFASRFIDLEIPRRKRYFS